MAGSGRRARAGNAKAVGITEFNKTRSDVLKMTCFKLQDCGLLISISVVMFDQPKYFTVKVCSHTPNMQFWVHQVSVIYLKDTIICRLQA